MRDRENLAAGQLHLDRLEGPDAQQFPKGFTFMGSSYP